MHWLSASLVGVPDAAKKACVVLRAGLLSSARQAKEEAGVWVFCGLFLAALGGSLQPVFWIPDVRAGLFLAEAPLSTDWPRVGARLQGFPWTRETGSMCQVSLDGGATEQGTMPRDLMPILHQSLYATYPATPGARAFPEHTAQQLGGWAGTQICLSFVHCPIDPPVCMSFL